MYQHKTKARRNPCQSTLTLGTVPIHHGNSFQGERKKGTLCSCCAGQGLKLGSQCTEAITRLSRGDDWDHADEPVMVKSLLQKGTVYRAEASSEVTQQAVTAVSWCFPHLPCTWVCSLGSGLLFHMQTLLMGEWKTFLLFRAIAVQSLAPQLLSIETVLQHL